MAAPDTSARVDIADRRLALPTGASTPAPLPHPHHSHRPPRRRPPPPRQTARQPAPRRSPPPSGRRQRRRGSPTRRGRCDRARRRLLPRPQLHRSPREPAPALPQSVRRPTVNRRNLNETEPKTVTNRHEPERLEPPTSALPWRGPWGAERCWFAAGSRASSVAPAVLDTRRYTRGFPWVLATRAQFVAKTLVDGGWCSWVCSGDAAGAGLESDRLRGRRVVGVGGGAGGGRTSRGRGGRSRCRIS
jgi:hypothetical protein